VVSMTNIREPVRMSRSISVSDYRRLIDAKDRVSIVAFIIERFEERYLDPVQTNHANKNGFTIMAVCCLMIEALESFRLGWSDSRKKSRVAFASFFAHWHLFAPFRGVADAFYDHVRCGILHQAETTGGWRVVRTGPALQGTTINAT